jgi:hypothetical protein
MHGALAQQTPAYEVSPSSEMEGARKAPEGGGEGQAREHEKVIRPYQRARLAGGAAGLLAIGLWGLASRAAASGTLTCDEDEGWNQRMQDQTMTVWDHAAPGSGLRAVKAGGIVEASPAAVWAVITDFNHYDHIFPFMEQPRVVGREDGDKRLFFYSVLAPPLIAKRDYTLDVHIAYAPNKDGRYRLSFVAGNDYSRAPPPLPGAVRVTDVHGFWEVKPWGLGFAHVAYCIRADPGGKLPSFFVNAAQLDAMPKIFAALRKAAAAPPK